MCIRDRLPRVSLLTCRALLPLADALLLPPLFTAHAENDATLWRQQRWLRSLPPARLAPELRGCLPAEPAALRGALHAVIAPLEALGFAETPADYLVGVHAAVQAINTHLAAASELSYCLCSYECAVEFVLQVDEAQLERMSVAGSLSASMSLPAALGNVTQTF